MTKEAQSLREQFESAIAMREAAHAAGVMDPAEAASLLKLGRAVADFARKPMGRAPSLAVPEWLKVLDKDGKHIITRDLTSGIEWDITDFNGKEFNAKQATEACKELRAGGFSDWRECDIRELLTTVNYDCYNPATYVEFFPNTKPGWYRTATPYKPDSGYRHGVHFGYGLSGSLLLGSSGFFVRAVRASQS